MKKITLTAFAFLTLSFLNAQALDPANRPKTALKLTKQTKVTMNQKITAEGQDMSTRMDNTTTGVYDVSAITPQGGSAEIKITAMKSSVESDAGEMSYDSQNPDEGNLQLGEGIKSAMKSPIKITLDANGFIATIKGSEKMESMLKSSGNSLTKGNPLDIFLKLDKAVKVNDTWKDISDSKEIKSTSNYTYKSFENGLATIEMITALTIDQDVEQMGNKVHTRLEGKMVSTLVVDVKTLIIKNKSTTTVMNGTADAQGQSIPISIFSTTTETVE